MLTMRARAIALSSISIPEPLFLKVATNPDLPVPLRKNSALLVENLDTAASSGFAVTLYRPGCFVQGADGPNHIELPESYAYLSKDDVIRVGPDLKLKTFYRRSANLNSILVTERCNSFCVMCSQPPKPDDDSHLVEDWLRALPLISTDTRELCITGGEPTLCGSQFFNLIRQIKALLPRTALHILSNGRTFKDQNLVDRLVELKHPDLMLGIPLYSDIPAIHDFVVQADGAFDETILGLINLKKAGVRIELRIVIHRHTYDRLPQLATFISRNLQFIDQVALMGMEIEGFARANLDDIWIDPMNYQRQLVEAIEILSTSHVKPLIFNHQLCLLDPQIRSFSVNSISDWKNEYMDECNGCVAKYRECGGFFSSAKYKCSSYISPILS